MCLLFESIKLQDGQFVRLPYHQQRVNKAFAALFPGDEPISLFEALSRHILPANGVYKCRVVYAGVVQSVECTPYVRREIKSLKCVETSVDSCEYKLEERSAFKAGFDLRGDCNDVILVKNGLITDTSYSNIALFDGTEWHTPRIPLLYGTNRAELLEKGKLIAKDIPVEDLKKYQQIALFNAMVEFGELVLEIDSILCLETYF